MSNTNTKLPPLTYNNVQNEIIRLESIRDDILDFNKKHGTVLPEHRELAQSSLELEIRFLEESGVDLTDQEKTDLATRWLTF